jgi:hypothetical protein
MWLSHHFRMRGQAEREKTLVHLFNIVNVVCLLDLAGDANLLILCMASERSQLLLQLEGLKSAQARGRQGAGRLTPPNSVQPEDIRDSHISASRTESDILILLEILHNVRGHANTDLSS